MKKKGFSLFLDFFILASMILLILPLCLQMWSLSGAGEFGLFADVSIMGGIIPNFQGVWATIVMVAAVILLAISVIYFIICMLELANVKVKGLKLIKKVLTLIGLVVALLAIVSAVVFTIVNVVGEGDYTISTQGEIGLWMLLGGAILFEAFSLIDAFRKK